MNEERFDLNPLCLAALHPNPAVVLDSDEPLFIRLHTVAMIQATLSEYHEQRLVITFNSGETHVLTTEQSREFLEKFGLIAANVQQQIANQQAQMEAAQRAAAAEAAKQLGITMN